jgi:hypothetical protein
MDSTRVDEALDGSRPMSQWSNEELFSLPAGDVAELQLAGVRRRYEQLRPQIRLLGRLAEDLDVSVISTLNDVTSLCLPHTTYKSYSVTHVEQGRYDKLTRWLQSLTAHDLSAVDVAGCESLESWLDAIEAVTPLRMRCSSGTSGKISFYPRSLAEERHQINSFVRSHGAFRQEPDSGLATGEVDYYSPAAVATGRHNTPAQFRLLREHIFAGRSGEHVHTLGDGHWDVDMIWLSGRLQAAEARGELAPMKLTPYLAALREKIGKQPAAGGQIDAFVDELIDAAGRRIFLFAPFHQMIPLAQEFEKRGATGSFAPDSYVLTGGRPGSKGVDFPTGWLELCQRVFPFRYVEVYGMTELTNSARLCASGVFHMPPSVVLWLLDPDTSQPLPREGVRTGRLAVFDLMPTTYWGGAITGDRVTIDWDARCSCGRIGPTISPEIVRYSNLRDDDKITCAKSPEAYQRAVELTLGAVEA